jgi:leucine-rich repeat protein SHOC2
MTDLNLKGNQLSSLPVEIGQLTALVQLLVSDNQLTSLPAEIGQLASLETLNFYGKFAGRDRAARVA